MSSNLYEILTLILLLLWQIAQLLEQTLQLIFLKRGEGDA